jgi:hypothetical protein
MVAQRGARFTLKVLRARRKFAERDAARRNKLLRPSPTSKQAPLIRPGRHQPTGRGNHPSA